MVRIRHICVVQSMFSKHSTSSAVIDVLEKDISYTVAFFYFDHSNPDKRDSRALVTSLVFQLAIQSEVGLICLEDARARYPGLPSYEQLLVVLSQLLRLSGPTIIVIDALDD